MTTSNGPRRKGAHETPDNSDPAVAIFELCAVLESLGYTIKERNTTAPLYDVFAVHPQNLSVIVNLFSDSAEVSCQWPWTDQAKENPGELLGVVNEMNALCRVVTCIADPEHMTVRACYPFAFDSNLFGAFMAAWMEDGKDILTEVYRGKSSCLNTELMH